MDVRLMDARLSLVLGGVRSGKSDFAEELALGLDKPTLYVATGLASDPEMEQRIRRHREARPAHWTTVEEKIDLAGCLESALGGEDAPAVAVVDSLDSWVSNLLHQHKGASANELESVVEAAVSELLKVARHSSSTIFFVSSEVGLTLVPPNPLGRRFQDLLWLVNRKVAAAADQVYLVVAGIPVVLKGPQSSPLSHREMGGPSAEQGPR